MTQNDYSQHNDLHDGDGISREEAARLEAELREQVARYERDLRELAET